MYDQHTGRKASESMHSGQRELKLVQVKKLQIAWLNLYGMPFHEQHSIGYGFPSLLLVTCASVFKHSWLRHSCLKTNSDTSAEAPVTRSSDGKPYRHECCSWKVTYISRYIEIFCGLIFFPMSHSIQYLTFKVETLSLILIEIKNENI